MNRPPSLRALSSYFLRLGTTGFGGPVALVGYMQRDLVEFAELRLSKPAPPLVSRSLK